MDHTKIRFIDKTGIKEALQSWIFPLVFLDFETINPAVPRYDGTSPYQQVPFQFSVHVLKSLDAEPVHYDYLHTESSDPRPVLIEKLLQACGDQGTVVAYFSQFESARLSELAEFSKKYALQLESIKNRLVDPLPIIRDNVYDGLFAGSFSLKKVAPALLGKSASYENMIVDNGTAAQRAFEKIINPKTDQEQRAELIDASIDYCRKDTLVMVDLVKWMFAQIKDC